MSFEEMRLIVESILVESSEDAGSRLEAEILDNLKTYTKLNGGVTKDQFVSCLRPIMIGHTNGDNVALNLPLMFSLRTLHFETVSGRPLKCDQHVHQRTAQLLKQALKMKKHDVNIVDESYAANFA